MSEEFRDRVDVRPNVKHKRGERVTGAMKRNRLIDSRSCHP